MLIAIALLSFTTVFIVLFLVLSTFSAGNNQMSMRLKAIEDFSARREDIDDELAKPFRQRVLAPFTRSIADVMAQFAPNTLRKVMEARLAAAGGFGKLTVNEFLLMCGVLLIGLPSIILFFGIALHLPGPKIFGMALLSVAVGMALPLVLLAQKTAVRRKNIQRDLPDVLDLLTVSVEAGLGFDGALAKLSEKMRGALVEEFSRVLQELRMGVPRRDALRSMGDRCGVSDLALFATSIIQADQLGVSIGSVLRVQSASLRGKRRQRAEERAMKAPVKMMIPLVLFIFPTVFIIILGPAAIRFVETMGR